jgi:hypothetical protein
MGEMGGGGGKGGTAGQGGGGGERSNSGTEHGNPDHWSMGGHDMGVSHMGT